jgi:AcrR family transcriptional regulator
MLHKTHRPHLSVVQDLRAVRTREALRQALLRLLETKTLEQLSIRDIAATAGVSYTTFFRHHTTKEALLDDIAAQQIRRLVELSLPSFEANDARAASLKLCTYVNDHRQLWSRLLTGGAANAMRDELLRIARRLAAASGEPSTWLPSDLATVFAVGATIELLTWWLRQEEPLSVERVAEIHEQLIIRPTVSPMPVADQSESTPTKPTRTSRKR